MALARSSSGDHAATSSHMAAVASEISSALRAGLLSLVAAASGLRRDTPISQDWSTSGTVSARATTRLTVSLSILLAHPAELTPIRAIPATRWAR